jgi:hypothetical protein
MVKSIVFKVSVRRRLGGKAQLEVEASHRHGKWSKATLCMRWRRLQRKGKGKAPAAAFRRQGKGPAATADAGESSSGGGCCRGRGSPEAAAAAVAEGGCSDRRGGGRAAPSGSKAESGGGRSTFYTRLLSLGIPVFWAMAQQFRLNCIG